MRILDNLLAIRILWLLVTPFENTDAYKLGVISNTGEFLKKAKTTEEKNSTSMLHRLVWRIKKFINLVPGGKTKIGSIVAAYALVRECYETDNMFPDDQHLNEQFDDTHLIEDFDDVLEYAACLLEDAPANAAGAAVSTDAPAIKKKIKKFKVSDKAFAGLKNGKNVSRRLGSYLDLEEDTDKEIFKYMNNEKSGMVILNDKNGKTKGVKFKHIDPTKNRSTNISAKEYLESYLESWELEALDYD